MVGDEVDGNGDVGVIDGGQHGRLGAEQRGKPAPAGRVRLNSRMLGRNLASSS
jgi:hypothetical protein